MAVAHVLSNSRHAKPCFDSCTSPPLNSHGPNFAFSSPPTNFSFPLPSPPPASCGSSSCSSSSSNAPSTARREARLQRGILGSSSSVSSGSSNASPISGSGRESPWQIGILASSRVWCSSRNAPITFRRETLLQGGILGSSSASSGSRNAPPISGRESPLQIGILASPCVSSSSRNAPIKSRRETLLQGGILGSSCVSSSGPNAPITSRRETLVQGGILGAGMLCGGLQAPPAHAGGVAGAENRPRFYELDGSGGVSALDIREGTGASPRKGDKVAIHYYARLAAKQGWRFDSSYDHKDPSGTPEPYVFVVGDGTVIAGLDSAVRTMKEGGVRRVVIPPSQGYQNTRQGPIPPNFSDRQRLYTTIFNPTRLANGESSTLGILVFDIELLKIRSP